MLTVRLPWATATVDTRTSRPITMMPERSSITILAGMSGSICTFDLGQQRHDLAGELRRDGELDGRGIERLGGRRADIVVDGGGDALRRGEVGIAQREPQVGSRLSVKSISRSMIAPLRSARPSERRA